MKGLPWSPVVALGLAAAASACTAPEPEAEEEPTASPVEPAEVILGEAVACASPSSASPLPFADVTDSSGVAHTPQTPVFPDPPDGTTTSSDIELLGGMAAADFDQDGALDLLFTDHTAPLRLFLGDGDLGFEEVDAEALGLSAGGAATIGVSPADFDADGDLDVFLCLNGPNRLLVQEDGRWEDRALELGVAGDLHRSTSAAWADADGDGDLDLFVTNYGRGTVGPGDQTAPQPDTLWLQQPDGTFAEALDVVPPGRDGYGFIGGWFDADDDGRPDLLVVNDIAISPEDDPPNLFLHNLGPDDDGLPRFETVPPAGLDVPMMGMGLAFGDYDGDGDVDVHVSDAGPTLLARNDGDLSFVDVSLLVEELGDRPDGDISWATRFFDHDADGRVELHTSFGHMPSKGVGGGPNATANALVQRDTLWRWSPATGSFEDVAEAAGVDDPRSSRTSLAVDLDRDGFPELVSWALYDGPRLFTPPCNDNRWAIVALGMPGTANPAAIGARVEARVGGELIASGTVEAGSTGVFSSQPPEVHLGLADHDAVDLLVQWPGGHATTHAAVPTRRRVEIRLVSP